MIFLPLKVFGVLLLIWLVFKLYERKNIYFPTKIVETTPEDIGIEYEDIFVKTEDGAIINGWFIPVSDPKATMLFCHGNGGNISHRLEIISIFHKLGYNVFIFDYRGYGRSRGWCSEKGTYRDAFAVYKYLIERGENVCIFGRSLGGAVAVDLATKVSKGVLICESSPTSIMDMAKVVYRFRIPAKLLSHRYDALSRIKNVTIPKLIIHGRNDEMVPFAQGELLFESAKEPKEFHQAKGSHNDIYLYEGYWEAIEGFIEKYIN